MKKQNRNLIQDLLDSDDELPSDYEEVADIPAYKDDNRFDPVDFPWINNNEEMMWNNNKLDSINQVPDDDFGFGSSKSNSFGEIVTKKLENISGIGKILLNKGVLSMQDVICLKYCVQTTSTNNSYSFDSLVTMLWFIEFLIKKDLQANYKFLKSCLVNDLCGNISYENYEKAPCDVEERYKVDIVYN